MYMCLWVYACECRSQWKPENGVRSSRAGVKNNHQLPVEGARDWTLVLHGSSKCSSCRTIPQGPILCHPVLVKWSKRFWLASSYKQLYGCPSVVSCYQEGIRTISVLSERCCVGCHLLRLLQGWRAHRTELYTLVVLNAGRSRWLPSNYRFIQSTISVYSSSTSSSSPLPPPPFLF